MAGEGLIGVQILQPAHHALAHGVELAEIGFGQGGPVGIAVGFAGLDGGVYPTGFLRVSWIAQDQPVTGGQRLLASTDVGRVVTPFAHQSCYCVLVARTGGRPFGLIDQGNQFWALGGRFLQVAHPACARDTGQRLGGFADSDGRELAHKAVLRQDEAASLADAAIGAGVSAALREDGIAIAGAGVAAGQRNAFDTAGREGLQLARLADAVLVQVAPDAQAGVLGVIGIEFAIRVGVKLRQRGKAVGRFLAIGQEGFIAEEFGSCVDQAVAVEVAHQHAVVRASPGGAGLDGVAVGVE